MGYAGIVVSNVTGMSVGFVVGRGDARVRIGVGAIGDKVGLSVRRKVVYDGKEVGFTSH